MPLQIPDWSPLSRRAFLSWYAGGIGSLALAQLMSDTARAVATPPGWPSVAKPGRAPAEPLLRLISNDLRGSAGASPSLNRPP